MKAAGYSLFARNFTIEENQQQSGITDAKNRARQLKQIRSGLMAATPVMPVSAFLTLTPGLALPWQ